MAQTNPNTPATIHAASPAEVEHEMSLTERILLDADRRSKVLEPTNFAEGERLAKKYESSGLADSEDQAFVRIQTAMALGIASVIALQHVYIVEGKPVLSAKLKLALARRNPEIEYIRCTELSATRVTFEGKRKEDAAPTVVTWTIEQANAITNGKYPADHPKKGQPKPLTEKDNWVNYPAQMLTARASSQIADLLSPESGLGLVSVEEARDIQVDPASLEIPEDMVARIAKRAEKKDGLAAKIKGAASKAEIDAAWSEVKAAIDAHDLTEADKTELAAIAKARRDQVAPKKANGGTPAHDPQTGELAPTAPAAGAAQLCSGPDPPPRG